MKSLFDHDYHIHSFLSACSKDPSQDTERILKYAKDEGLKKIVLTDHYWDEKIPLKNSWYAHQNTEHIKKSLPLPVSEGVEFCFGAEGELDADCVLGISKERFDELDFVVIPTTHMHMPGFEVFEDDEEQIKNRAKLWVERFEWLLSQDLPFHKIGVAHLACTLGFSRALAHLPDALFAKGLDLIKNDDLYRVFSLAQKKGCGIELNKIDMDYNDITKNSVLRIFKVAKECGCKFYFGSDTHKVIENEGTREIFERAVVDLGLTEDDMFHF